MKMHDKENVDEESYAHWAALVKKKKRLIVFYGDDVLDLTSFAIIHPAGEKAISCYLLQDIKNILFRIYPHPESAVQNLKKYICGKIKKNHNVQTKDVSQQQQPKRICKNKSFFKTKKEQNKKVSFDNAPAVQLIEKKIEKKIGHKKQAFCEIEDNIMSLEENKPPLTVPFFDGNMFFFGKSKEEYSEDGQTASKLN